MNSEWYSLFGAPMKEWAKLNEVMTKNSTTVADLTKAISQGDYNATKLHARIQVLEAKLREIQNICGE